MFYHAKKIALASLVLAGTALPTFAKPMKLMLTNHTTNSVNVTVHSSGTKHSTQTLAGLGDELTVKPTKDLSFKIGLPGGSYSLSTDTGEKCTTTEGKKGVAIDTVYHDQQGNRIGAKSVFCARVRDEQSNACAIVGVYEKNLQFQSCEK